MMNSSPFKSCFSLLVFFMAPSTEISLDVEDFSILVEIPFEVLLSQGGIARDQVHPLHETRRIGLDARAHRHAAGNLGDELLAFSGEEKIDKQPGGVRMRGPGGDADTVVVR